MNLVITKYSRITEEGLGRNDRIILKNVDNDPGVFFKEIYQKLDCGYPKYYKMDPLSKLAFLAVENLLADYDNFPEYPKDKISIVFQNKSSSLETDIRHQESIADRKNYFPSPSVFVYTLPNIMLGEICIRHKIQGENSCFLEEQFNPEFIFHYVNILFEKEGTECCITGWVDFFENNYQANLFLVEKETAVDTYITKFEKDLLELMIKNNGRID